jgi:hypothetical protein
METADILEQDKVERNKLTRAQKEIDLKARINTFEYIENYNCKCDKKKLPELFSEIAAVKWELQQQLNELDHEL